MIVGSGAREEIVATFSQAVATLTAVDGVFSEVGELLVDAFRLEDEKSLDKSAVIGLGFEGVARLKRAFFCRSLSLRESEMLPKPRNKVGDVGSVVLAKPSLRPFRS